MYTQDKGAQGKMIQDQLKQFSIITSKLKDETSVKKMSQHRLATLKVRAQKYSKLQAANKFGSFN
jgi:hypothetical protein